MSGVSPHCRRVLEGFEANKKNICYSFREVRAVVLCKAWEYMEEEHIPFRSAIRKAWDWVKDECARIGAFI